MKLVIVSSYAPEIISFRGDLIKEFQRKGYEVFAVVPYDKESFSVLKEKFSVEMVEWDLERAGTNPFKDLKSIFDLRKHLRTIHPDVVLAYTVKPVVYTGLIAPNSSHTIALMSGLGSITRNTDKQLSTRVTRKILHTLYFLSYKKYNKIIFQNSDDMNLMIEEKIVSPEKAYVVNGSGVDTYQFDYKTPKAELSFLYVGRLLRDKGIYELIEASRKFKEKYPNVEIGIIGSLDDNPTSLKKEELDEIINEGIITYHGQVEDVKAYLHQYSILIHPSYHEGTSRAVLEALSTGRVIITTNAPGCYPTVSNDNGWVTEAGNSESLYRAMIEAMSEPYEKIILMSKRSRVLAEKVYDVQKVNKSMLRIVEDKYEKLNN